jgi:hypothetical protein
MQAMEKLGLDMAISKTAETLEEARDIAKNVIGEFPIIVRPAFTLGGTGGGIAYNQEEFEHIVDGGLDASMTNQVRGVPRLPRSIRCSGPWRGPWTPAYEKPWLCRAHVSAGAGAQ